jgi:hypothetical protein
VRGAKERGPTAEDMVRRSVLPRRRCVCRCVQRCFKPSRPVSTCNGRLVCASLPRRRALPHANFIAPPARTFHAPCRSSRTGSRRKRVASALAAARLQIGFLQRPRADRQHCVDGKRQSRRHGRGVCAPLHTVL